METQGVEQAPETPKPRQPRQRTLDQYTTIYDSLAQSGNYPRDFKPSAFQLSMHKKVAYPTGMNTLVISPTGTGKTFMMCDFAFEAYKRRLSNTENIGDTLVLIACPYVVIVDQVIKCIQDMNMSFDEDKMIRVKQLTGSVLNKKLTGYWARQHGYALLGRDAPERPLGSPPIKVACDVIVGTPECLVALFDKRRADKGLLSLAAETKKIILVMDEFQEYVNLESTRFPAFSSLVERFEDIRTKLAARCAYKVGVHQKSAWSCMCGFTGAFSSFTQNPNTPATTPSAFRKAIAQEFDVVENEFVPKLFNFVASGERFAELPLRAMAISHMKRRRMDTYKGCFLIIVNHIEQISHIFPRIARALTKLYTDLGLPLDDDDYFYAQATGDEALDKNELFIEQRHRKDVMRVRVANNRKPGEKVLDGTVMRDINTPGGMEEYCRRKGVHVTTALQKSENELIKYMADRGVLPPVIVSTQKIAIGADLPHIAGVYIVSTGMPLSDETVNQWIGRTNRERESSMVFIDGKIVSERNRPESVMQTTPRGLWNVLPVFTQGSFIARLGYTLPSTVRVFTMQDYILKPMESVVPTNIQFVERLSVRHISQEVSVAQRKDALCGMACLAKFFCIPMTGLYTKHLLLPLIPSRSIPSAGLGLFWPPAVNTMAQHVIEQCCSALNMSSEQRSVFVAGIMVKGAVNTVTVTRTQCLLSSHQAKIAQIISMLSPGDLLVLSWIMVEFFTKSLSYRIPSNEVNYIRYDKDAKRLINENGTVLHGTDMFALFDIAQFICLPVFMCETVGGDMREDPAKQNFVRYFFTEQRNAPQGNNRLKSLYLLMERLSAAPLQGLWLDINFSPNKDRNTINDLLSAIASFGLTADGDESDYAWCIQNHPFSTFIREVGRVITKVWPEGLSVATMPSNEKSTARQDYAQKLLKSEEASFEESGIYGQRVQMLDSEKRRRELRRQPEIVPMDDEPVIEEQQTQFIEDDTSLAVIPGVTVPEDTPKERLLAMFEQQQLKEMGMIDIAQAVAMLDKQVMPAEQPTPWEDLAAHTWAQFFAKCLVFARAQMTPEKMGTVDKVAEHGGPMFIAIGYLMNLYDVAGYIDRDGTLYDISFTPKSPTQRAPSPTVVKLIARVHSTVST